MTTQPTQKYCLGFGGHRPAMFLDPSGGALQKPPRIYLAFTKFSKVRTTTGGFLSYFALYKQFRGGCVIQRHHPITH